MNRIKRAFEQKKPLISIYATAGFPALNDTVDVLESLEHAGADMIEIGLPFSDPLADGPTIQQSSTKALENGMSTKVLFDQLKGIREKVSIPLVIMGYFNPVLQFGVAEFCAKCEEVGIDGLILPDLPLEIYLRDYQAIFKRHGLSMIFLITPQTSEARIRAIEAASDTFIYMVSSSSTTGSTSGFSEAHMAYFKRIADMNLSVETLVGFGIADAHTFNQASQYTRGAIIGSAFIRYLEANGKENISPFINKLNGKYV